jgi:hypothetical protein
MSGKIGIGWSIQLHYQPKDLEELKAAAKFLTSLGLPYSGSISGVSAANPTGGGNGHQPITKEFLGQLIELARKKKVFLAKEVRRDLHKELEDLTEGEGQNISQQLNRM